ncbi:hypothetical protein V6N12_076420 [Hibiscus sabdariffa]|uniref:Uncharacterized protein n=1 Tax=Hibiscus sabdariffa TaxID=183260 RepID=A0ABR2D9R0_9ROSI
MCNTNYWLAYVRCCRCACRDAHEDELASKVFSVRHSFFKVVLSSHSIVNPYHRICSIAASTSSIHGDHFSNPLLVFDSSQHGASTVVSSSTSPTSVLPGNITSTDNSGNTAEFTTPQMITLLMPLYMMCMMLSCL